MLLVDTKEKKMIQDVELKTYVSTARPYSQWLSEQVNYCITLYVWESSVCQIFIYVPLIRVFFSVMRP